MQSNYYIIKALVNTHVGHVEATLTSYRGKVLTETNAPHKAQTPKEAALFWKRNKTLQASPMPGLKGHVAEFTTLKQGD